MYDYYLGEERDKLLREVEMNCEYTKEEKLERKNEITKYFLKFQDKSYKGRLLP